LRRRIPITAAKVTTIFGRVANLTATKSGLKDYILSWRKPEIGRYLAELGHYVKDERLSAGEKALQQVLELEPNTTRQTSI